MKIRKVMASAGGGVKGIGQVEVLCKLEAEAQAPLHEAYSLLIGSSVGAIDMAMAASGKQPMATLRDEYPNMIKRIFKKRLFGFPKYNRKYFHEVWDELIGNNYKVGEIQTRLMITSVDLVSNNNFFFKSWNEEMADMNLVDIVMRSFAAPVFFGHIVDKQEQRVWSDGGIGSMNLPLFELKTQIESFHWYEVPGMPSTEETGKVLVDAVGCLYPKTSEPFEKVARQGWFSQAMDYIHPSQGGIARIQSRQDNVGMMQYIAERNSTLAFRYWDMEIPLKKDGLDKVKFLDYYREMGKKVAEKPLIEVSFEENRLINFDPSDDNNG